jgi:hypothetical protein
MICEVLIKFKYSFGGCGRFSNAAILADLCFEFCLRDGNPTNE